MADHARLLISKIVADKDITTAAQAGVRASWFDDIDHRDTYRWVTDYWSRYGEAPTRGALKSQFPNYRLLVTEEPYAYYIDQLREQHKRSVLVDTVIDANTA